MFSIAVLPAQNHMDLILSLEGAHENAGIGLYKAAIDFNADGYDDLILSQTRNYDTNEPGKLFCFFGGPVLNGVPDLICQGETWNQGPGFLLTPGDFNGDGFMDIMDSVVIVESTLQKGLRFFYGGPGADLVPDHIIPMASLGTPFSSEFIIRENIGDINNDGCDDIGAFHITPDSLQTRSLAIIFGGSFQSVTVIDNLVMGSVYGISYAGDVNGDGIDDFSVSNAPLNSIVHYLYIYYGNDGYWDPLDRVLIFDNNTEPYNSYPFAFGIGDFNLDGYDDYLGMWVESPGNSGFEIKLGSSTLPNSPELLVRSTPWDYHINVNFREVSFGDFNGDGYSDMIACDHEAGGWSGVALIWLGASYPNGLMDLRIQPPPVSSYYQFGYNMPAVGHFNGDGYDDVAICAPQSQSGTTGYRGWLHVYAGNGQLSDTPVDNDDQVLQPGAPDLKVFPNPSSRERVIWNFQLQGLQPKSGSLLRMEIYNLRGQLVGSYSVDNSEYLDGSLGPLKLVPGVYLASYIADNEIVASTKFTVK